MGSEFPRLLTVVTALSLVTWESELLHLSSDRKNPREWPERVREGPEKVALRGGHRHVATCIHTCSWGWEASWSWVCSRGQMLQFPEWWGSRVQHDACAPEGNLIRGTAEQSGPGPLCQPYFKAELSGKQVGKGSCLPLPARPAITSRKAVLTHYILPRKTRKTLHLGRKRRCKEQGASSETGSTLWTWCEPPWRQSL